MVLLERSALASQISPRASGLSSQVRATPALTKLAQRAVAKLAAFTGETGQPLRFTQSGALKIARTEPDAEQLAEGERAGVPIDFVSVAEARKRPGHVESDGRATSSLPIGYCRAAEKLGAVLLPHPSCRRAISSYHRVHRRGRARVSDRPRDRRQRLRAPRTQRAQRLPALAEAIAERIVDGAPALNLSEISSARLAGHDLDEAELRERCRRAYATHYRAGSETPAGPETASTVYLFGRISLESLTGVGS